MQGLRPFFTSIILACAVSGGAFAQSVTDGPGAELRVLDKLTGDVIDMSLRIGETGKLGFLLSLIHI